jgi:uncharacterized protein YkwD
MPGRRLGTEDAVRDGQDATGPGTAVAAVVVTALGVAVILVLLGRSAPATVVADGPSLEESRAIGWSDPAAAAGLAHDLFVRVNDERAARGAPPLTWHPGLAATAERWSEHMISTGTFEHSSEAFREHPDFHGTGENILMGHTSSDDAHVGWMESEGHREAILLADFDAVGIGVVCRDDGRMWATQVFGVAARRHSSRTAVDTSPEPVVRRDPGLPCPPPDGD